LNIAVTGFGAYDGTFFIMKGTHKLDRDSGYSTEVELRRIPS
jgi:phage protein D